jgi:hypothetical protein
MQVPEQPDLPFFAYGLFRPGQLGFLRLKEFVESATSLTIPGELRLRDGLPIADRQGGGAITGSLLQFKTGMGSQAYQRVVDIEPDHQYIWGQTAANGIVCNVLWGKSPQKGTVPLDEPDWDGRIDPLFTAALEVVEEALREHSTFKWDLKPMFRLQMAYLLLWSAIERYTSLRYHLADKAFDKVVQLAAEPAFAKAMSDIEAPQRSVQRADRPSDRVRFDPQNPVRCIEYYYQLRSNVVHRGKGVPRDHDRIREALSELLPAFRATLAHAFAAADLDA